MTVFQLPDEPVFPDVKFAEKDGLLAVGGDLSIERLIEAYTHGIFPWYAEEDPILWWSPDPRFVLFPEKYKVSRSLARIIKKEIFTIDFDTNFRRVIEYCSEIVRPDQHGTWITREMKDAYIRLHEAGYAHSVETYKEGKLVGGLYGVAIGHIFFGESMFRFVSDASKFALYHLVNKVREMGFLLIDSQMETDHLKTMGAQKIPRKQYLRILDEALKFPFVTGKW